MPTRVFQRWLSGFTQRWHTHPRLRDTHDAVDGHHGRCGMLLLTLFPNYSRELMHAMIVHDAPEWIVGDLTTPAKRKYPKLGAAYQDAEYSALLGMGLYTALSDMDRAILRFIDKLDAYLWATYHLPDGVDDKAWILRNEDLRAMAGNLGLSADVIKELLG